MVQLSTMERHLGELSSTTVLPLAAAGFENIALNYYRGQII
jgi:hypothetical protein